jgi:putative tricarboxylic transport membrane protein
MTALLGGHVDAMASAPSTLRQHVKSGKVRLLAIVAPQRLAGDFAAVPTWKELGIDVTFELWRGLAGPRNLSVAQIRFWDDSLGRMVKTSDWKDQLALSGMEDVYRNSAQTAAYWKAQDAQVRAVLTELGLAK